MEIAKHPLPVSQKELEELGIGQPDFIIVSGDAYIDHPSFGTALIGRLLERAGFSVAVIPQPDWRSTKDFERFGRPRLAFLVNAGNIDSMVANYRCQTAQGLRLLFSRWKDWETTRSGGDRLLQ